MNLNKFSGKNIIVTGASSGLGRSTCILLSKLDTRVCLVGRDTDRLEETRREMAGGEHLVIVQDLCRFEDYRSLFKNITEGMGTIHGLVHAAGIRKTQPLRAMSTHSLREIFDINLNAFIELMKGFARKGVAADGASAVAFSSVSALRGVTSLAGYGASKAALDAVVRSLACELAARQIRVNSIAPGHVETEMNLKVKDSLSPEAYEKIIEGHPLGLGQPDDIANMVVFLLSDAARWITGTTIPVDGGFTARS